MFGWVIPELFKKQSNFNKHLKGFVPHCTCIGCQATFTKYCGLETHKRTCRSQKTKTRKLKTLIWTLSLSAHRNNTQHHEIPGQQLEEVTMSPERIKEGDLNLNEPPVGIYCWFFLYLRLINYMQAPSPPTQEYQPDGRPRWRARLPQRFCNDLPPPAPPVIPEPNPQPNIGPDREPIVAPPDFRSEQNTFGIFRVYKCGKPTFNPDDIEIFNPETPPPFLPPFQQLYHFSTHVLVL